MVGSYIELVRIRTASGGPVEETGRGVGGENEVVLQKVQRRAGQAASLDSISGEGVFERRRGIRRIRPRRGWIEDRRTQFREIPGAHFFRGNQGIEEAGAAQARGLVVGENERPVLDDRAAAGGSELVLPHDSLFGRRRVEKVPGIQPVVA
jgi:hypothetical protein